MSTQTQDQNRHAPAPIATTPTGEQFVYTIYIRTTPEKNSSPRSPNQSSLPPTGEVSPTTPHGNPARPGHSSLPTVASLTPARSSSTTHPPHRPRLAPSALLRAQFRRRLSLRY